MHSQEQVEMIVQALFDTKPKDIARFMSENQAGMRAVLRLLYVSDEVMTAGKIAQEIGVSGARVAALLKKMVEKNLIVKEPAANDARVTIVRLTPYGIDIANALQQELYEQIGNVIDKIGIDRMIEFVSISKEIHEALAPPTISI